MLFLVACLAIFSEAAAGDLERERLPFDTTTMAVQGATGFVAATGMTVVGLYALASSGVSPDGSFMITLAAIPLVTSVVVGFTGYRRGLGKNELGTAVGGLAGGLVGGAVGIADLKKEPDGLFPGAYLLILGAPVLGNIIGYHLQAERSRSAGDPHSIPAILHPAQPWWLRWGTSF